MIPRNALSTPRPTALTPKAEVTRVSTERRVTVKDVAQRAGVSQATVSYVLNETPGQTITPATQERVRAAVRDLGYTPSRVARALRSGRSDIILLILPDAPVGANLARVMDGIERAMDETGHVTVTRRKHPGQSLGPLVNDLSPAAIVCFAPLGEEDEGWLSSTNSPVVQTLKDAPPGVGAAYTDAEGARLQVDHLAERGHTRLGIAIPKSTYLMEYAARRIRGIIERCVELGLPEPVAVPLDMTAEDGLTAVRTWKDAGVTGVCAYNDQYAMAVLAGLRLAGRQAPDDLAVIGLDDHPLSPLTNPPLTSVRVRVNTVIAWANGRVLELLGLPAPEVALDPDPLSVVVREST